MLVSKERVGIVIEGTWKMDLSLFLRRVFINLKMLIFILDKIGSYWGISSKGKFCVLENGFGCCLGDRCECIRIKGE